jgi:hypothetical protein
MAINPTLDLVITDTDWTGAPGPYAVSKSMNSRTVTRFGTVIASPSSPYTKLNIVTSSSKPVLSQT